MPRHRVCWPREANISRTTSSPSTSTCATITSTPPTPSSRRRSTAASPPINRAIRRSMQLATGGAISDVIHLSCIHPLQPGDEDYANCLAVPVNAPGVKLYPRRSFAMVATNAFHYPLSSRFDETDSYVVFDNVFVPWERVFIYRNLELSRDQWWKTHLYGNHQAQVRYVIKLRFMIGVAQRMNEMTGNAGNPAVQIMMGEL